MLEAWMVQEQSGLSGLSPEYKIKYSSNPVNENISLNKVLY